MCSGEASRRRRERALSARRQRGRSSALRRRSVRGLRSRPHRGPASSLCSTTGAAVIALAALGLPLIKRSLGISNAVGPPAAFLAGPKSKTNGALPGSALAEFLMKGRCSLIRSARPLPRRVSSLYRCCFVALETTTTTTDGDRCK